MDYMPHTAVKQTPKRTKTFYDVHSDTIVHTAGDRAYAACFKNITTGSDKNYFKRANGKLYNIKPEYKLKLLYGIPEIQLYSFSVVDERSTLPPTYKVNLYKNEFAWDYEVETNNVAPTTIADIKYKDREKYLKIEVDDHHKDIK